MNRTALFLLATFWSGLALAAEAVENTSYVLPNGERVLRQSGVVRAPIAEVWKAFTTTEGFRSFAAPVAAIELRVGAIWEASYRLEAKIGEPGNIQNEVLSYLPERMLSIRVRRTPPGFPHPEVAKSVWTVVLFEEVSGGMTRVTEVMLGWKSGPEWDEIYRFFERGNAIVLLRLQQRFDSGPINWKEIIESPKRP